MSITLILNNIFRFFSNSGQPFIFVAATAVIIWNPIMNNKMKNLTNMITSKFKKMDKDFADLKETVGDYEETNLMQKKIRKATQHAITYIQDVTLKAHIIDIESAFLKFIQECQNIGLENIHEHEVRNLVMTKYNSIVEISKERFGEDGTKEGIETGDFDPEGTIKEIVHIKDDYINSKQHRFRVVLEGKIIKIYRHLIDFNANNPINHKRRENDNK